MHWGQWWTPGANWATTIEVDHDVRVEGQLLPKGKYSVPDQPLREFILGPGPGSDDELTRAQRNSDGQWWTQSGFSVAFTIANGIASGFEVRVEDGAVTG